MKITLLMIGRKPTQMGFSLFDLLHCALYYWCFSWLFLVYNISTPSFDLNSTSFLETRIYLIIPISSFIWYVTINSQIVSWGFSGVKLTWFKTSWKQNKFWKFSIEPHFTTSKQGAPVTTIYIHQVLTTVIDLFGRSKLSMLPPIVNINVYIKCYYWNVIKTGFTNA